MYHSAINALISSSESHSSALAVGIKEEDGLGVGVFFLLAKVCETSDLTMDGCFAYGAGTGAVVGWPTEDQNGLSVDDWSSEKSKRLNAILFGITEFSRAFGRGFLWSCE